jgi:hypothetical protein
MAGMKACPAMVWGSLPSGKFLLLGGVVVVVLVGVEWRLCSKYAVIIFIKARLAACMSANAGSVSGIGIIGGLVVGGTGRETEVGADAEVVASFKDVSEGGCPRARGEARVPEVGAFRGPRDVHMQWVPRAKGRELGGRVRGEVDRRENVSNTKTAVVPFSEGSVDARDSDGDGEGCVCCFEGSPSDEAPCECGDEVVSSCIR